jgi:hypothetical protein
MTNSKKETKYLAGSIKMPIFAAEISNPPGS